MPGLRSAYKVSTASATLAQLHRLQRDDWYRSSRSRVGMKVVEVPRLLAPSIMHRAAARQLHHVSRRPPRPSWADESDDSDNCREHGTTSSGVLDCVFPVDIVFVNDPWADATLLPVGASAVPVSPPVSGIVHEDSWSAWKKMETVAKESKVSTADASTQTEDEMPLELLKSCLGSESLGSELPEELVGMSLEELFGDQDQDNDCDVVDSETDGVLAGDDDAAGVGEATRCSRGDVEMLKLHEEEVGLADILKSAIASMGLLKAADLQCIRDEIRKEVLDVANLRKEGLRKKMDVLYGRVAAMHSRINDIEHTVFATNTVYVAEEEDVEEELVQGSVVRIFGLTARPELNGEVGRAVQFDVKKDRWQVRLAHGDLLLQAKNLMPFDT